MNTTSKTMTRTGLTLIPACIALFAGLWLFSSSQVAGANNNNVHNTIIVTTTDVELDENDNQCSLREAILSANKNQAVSDNAGECPAGSATSTDEIILTNGATYALMTDGNDAETGDLDIFNNTETDLDVILVTADLGSPATIDASAINNRVIEVTIDASVIISNVVIRGGSNMSGAGLFSSGGTVTVTHSFIQNNNGLTGGGVANYDGRITLIDSHVILNTASQSGGAMYNAGSAAHLVIQNTLVRANTAEGLAGGGIINDKGHVVIEQNSFINLNRSKLDGGGIYSVEGSLIIRDSTFQGNEAGYTNDNTADGGAIYSPSNNSSSEITIHNTTITDNEAHQYGGGVHGLKVTMTNSLVSFNLARNTGGGLYIIDANLTDVELTGNESTLGAGGGLYSEQFVGTGLYIHDNHAQDSGGGIWTDQIELSHSRVLSNTTQGNGGGIYFRTGTGEISNSAVAHNTSVKDGAGIWADGNLALTNVTLSTNSTNAGNGGGIYIEAAGNVKAINTTIALNSPGYDVYKAGELTLRNSLINTPDTPNCFFIATPIVSLGNNISDDASCDGLTQATDQYTADTILQPLADNGGDTLTHALGQGSPAIDAGDNTACMAGPVNNVDQRGLPRDVGSACDIGAFEVAYIVMLPLIIK